MSTLTGRLHPFTVSLQKTTTKLLPSVAVAAAAGLSVMALWDAARNALAPSGTPPWDPSREPELIFRGVSLLHGVVYLLLASVLAKFGLLIDGDSRALPWLRRILVICYLIMGLPFLASGMFAADLETDAPAWVQMAIPVAFLGAFVAAIAIGLLLLRHHQLRLAGWLLASPVVILPLTLLLDSVSRWGHPGYLETAVNMGTALLGFTASREQRRPHGELFEPADFREDH